MKMCMKFLMLFLLIISLKGISTFAVVRYDTSANLKNFMQNSLKAGNMKIEFTSKLSMGSVSSVLNTIMGSNYEYSYSKDYSFTKIGNKFLVDFNSQFSQKDIRSMNTAVDTKVKSIVLIVVKRGMSPYEKELALHDYLVNNTKYDVDNYNNNTVPFISYTPYGALIKGVAVCEGYSKALNLLLKAAGIQSIIVSGSAEGGSHAWNIVKLGKDYYHVDATWDDPVTSTNQQVLSHQYFNLTDGKMAEDHVWNKKDYPSCNGSVYAYKNDIEMKDLSLVKTYNDFFAISRQHILNKDSSFTISVFQYNTKTYNLNTMLDNLNNDTSLGYYITSIEWRISTVGSTSTITFNVAYSDK